MVVTVEDSRHEPEPGEVDGDARRSARTFGRPTTTRPPGDVDVQRPVEASALVEDHRASKDEGALPTFTFRLAVGRDVRDRVVARVQVIAQRGERTRCVAAFERVDDVLVLANDLLEHARRAARAETHDADEAA